jgi:3-methyladenine DNA glycosylase AlkD
LLKRIRFDLTNAADEKTRSGYPRFFKEDIKYYGVKTAIVNRIADNYWKEIRSQSKEDIFALCTELFRSGFCEESFIAARWLAKMTDRFESGDIQAFHDWIEKHITNWASCDTLCNHSLADYIKKFPDKISDLKSWTLSSNRWLRRGAAVTLILPARRGTFKDDALEICETLLTDKDDLVQKGYGWLLKELSRQRRTDVFDFVRERKDRMPRTALRYAIERMPADLRKEAMKKEIAKTVKR